MSAATIAAFERAINNLSDALANHLTEERTVVRAATAAGDQGRAARAVARINMLESLRHGPLYSLGRGFGTALPDRDGPDQDLLR